MYVKSLLRPGDDGDKNNRLMYSATADNGVPADVTGASPETGDVGYTVRDNRWLHLELEAVAQNVTFTVYTRRTGMSSLWCEEVGLGDIAVSAGKRVIKRLELDGASFVYVRVNPTAGGTGKVWGGTTSA